MEGGGWKKPERCQGNVCQGNNPENACRASVLAGRARTSCAPRRPEDCPPCLFPPPSLTRHKRFFHSLDKHSFDFGAFVFQFRSEGGAPMLDRIFSIIMILGRSAAFCRKSLRRAGVAADGNPPPTFYAAGLLRWRHRFPDFGAALPQKRAPGEKREKRGCKGHGFGQYRPRIQH